MGKKRSQGAPHRPRIVNRRARHDYDILEVVECGIELTGTEVKSLRAGQVTIDEAHGRLRDGELYLAGATIAHYPQARGVLQHDPTRERKLLVHRRQLDQITAHVMQKGKTLIPMDIYFKRGWAKCRLGLAIGKKLYDKRQAMRKADQQREINREIVRRQRG